MATIVTPSWDAAHVAVHREDLIGGRGQSELSLLRHPSYPFLAEISADPSTLFAELREVAETYVACVAPLDPSLADALKLLTAKGSPDGFGWLPITWDGTSRIDPRGSFAVRRVRNGTELDRTIVLMAANRWLTGDAIANIATVDGLAVGLRVVMHVDPAIQDNVVPIRVTGLSMCELRRALCPEVMTELIEQYGRHHGHVVGVAKETLGFSRAKVTGCDLTSGVLRFAGVGARSGPGKDQLATGFLWCVEAAPDQGTLPISAVRAQKQHTYAVAPAAPDPNKGGSSKTSSRTKKKPRLFFRDPASCGGALDVLERSPTRDAIDKFREDVLFLLPPELENPERFQVLQSTVADPENDSLKVQSIDPLELPLRSDHLSAAQAYLRAREFFAKLSAFDLPEKEYFKFSRLPLLMRPRAAFSAHPDGNQVIAQVRVVGTGEETTDTGISSKAASDRATSEVKVEPWPQLEVAFGSAALRFRELLKNDHGRDSAQPLGLAADPRWAWHEFGHVVSYAATGALEYEFAHSAGDALAAVLNDATSELAGKGLYDGETYPWVPTGRRHDRDAASGWCWCGRRNGQRHAKPTFPPLLFKGYVEEQMLSSSVFRFYRAIGGHPDNNKDMRKRAADATAYLLMRATLLLGPGTMVPARSADAMVSAMVDADIGTRQPDAMVSAMVDAEIGTRRQPLFLGGCLHKVVRWSFERQGLFATASPAEIVEGPGLAPSVDLWVKDRRPNAKQGGYESVTLKWPSAKHVPDWFADSRKDEGVWNDADGNIHVIVRNRGADDATNVTVKAWAAPSGSGSPTRFNWQPLGHAHLDRVPGLDKMPDGGFARATIAAKLNGASQYVLVEVSSSEDRSNLDAETRLPCATYAVGDTPPIQPEIVRDLVANDNNLALCLIKEPSAAAELQGRSAATRRQRGKRRAR
jgi:hypothetical protein